MLYEACVILNARLSEEETEALVEKLKDQLTSGGAEIRQVALWGKRRLAQEIDKAAEGYYVIFFFDLNKVGQLFVNFNQSCGYDENILGVMTIKVTEKKKGQVIKPLIPAPGWLSEFTMKMKPVAARRGSRGPMRGDHHPTRPAEAAAPARSAPAPARCC
ncbi:30S ribosomal protein S6 [Candidatus Sumerlaeota bacterium]|nr:30S ribosomal protein S6 [Candidatus Sumerlaeota bacterium]